MAFGKKQHTARKIAIGSALAGAAGYLAGILTAPKSGKDTRQDIANKAEDVKYGAEDELQAASVELKELLSKTKDKTVAMGSSARAEFNEAVIKAKDAQNKTGEVLKAVKKGEASDPELNKAVKQARQAAKNLAKYLKS
jgi:gas vesicle protein